MSKFWLFTTVLLSSSLTYAEENGQFDKDIPSPWNSEVEFGFQSHTGNSDSRSLNTRLSTEYIEGRHRTDGEWKYYQLYKDGKEDKRQSSYSVQTDYKLSAKTYLYGSFKGIDSRYSAYFKDYTISGGLGYQFFNTEELTLEIEVGPGYRYQEPNLDEIGSKDIVFPNTVQEGIFRSNVNTKWQILESLHLSGSLTIVSGASNTSLDTELAATNNITEDIALKLSHSRQYHDKVPQGLNKADSIFSINLLFAF